MNVLLTNDDGIYAIGLRSLYSALRMAGHAIFVAAPMYQQSGVGHSLTVFEPLRAKQIVDGEFCGMGIYGTPADCVKLALAKFLPEIPDLVMSGINIGPNVGPDIPYSGTIGAAAEAALANLPSMSISYDSYQADDLSEQANHAVELAHKIDWKSLRARQVVNVNYPKCPLKQSAGLRICPQENATWENNYLERKDPRGDKYWWLDGEIIQGKISTDSDRKSLSNGYITITPLCFDFTDHAAMQTLEKMIFQ